MLQPAATFTPRAGFARRVWRGRHIIAWHAAQQSAGYDALKTPSPSRGGTGSLRQIGCTISDLIYNLSHRGRKMTRAAKSRVTNDGVKGFFERAGAHARKLDRGEPLTPEIVVSFEDASELLRVLSSERVRLLSVAKKRPASISELASGLKRDARAVSRDVDLLESLGLLLTRYEANPGHGKRRIVEPRASQYKLVANI